MTQDRRLAACRINDCELSVRAINALQRWGHAKTLADLDELTDEQLSRVPHLGPKCIREVRDVIRAVRFSVLSLDEELVAWVGEHRTLVLALMRGEATIMPREARS